MYGVHLRVGGCFDVALVDANGETVLPNTIFKNVTKIAVAKPGVAPTDAEKRNESYIIINPEFVRLTCADSYCRGYATDNVWWVIKSLIVELNKQAFISFKDKINDKVAAGAICISTPDSVNDYYGNHAPIRTYLNSDDDAKSDELARHLDGTIGMLSLAIDKRPGAAEYFASHLPDSGRYFFTEKNRITYAYSTNWWAFSPALTHLVYGAARIGFGMLVNKVAWPKKYTPDVARDIILARDVKAAIEFVQNTHRTLGRVGFIATTYNPYVEVANNTFIDKFDFLVEHGPECLGPTIYDNWRMKRRKTHYVGHLNDLPSWENSFEKIFNKKSNKDYGLLWKERKGKKPNPNERIQQPF